MLNKKVIVWISLYVLSSVSCQIDNKCNGTKVESTCTLVFSCDYVLKLIREGELTLAKSTLCGFQSGKPMVCCPSGTEIVFDSDTNRTMTSPKHETTPQLLTTEPVTTPPPATTPQPTSIPQNVSAQEPITTPQPSTTPQPEITPKPVATATYVTTPRPLPTAKLPVTAPNPSMTSKPEVTSRTPVINEIATSPTILPDTKICGRYAIEDRIIGGETTAIDEYPWMAQLKFFHRNKEVYACAGTLITDRHVVTAAHCVLKKVLSVRLGEYDTSTEIDCVESDCNDKPVDVLVKEVIPYPAFSLQDITQGDIAVLVLAESVKFTDFIQPLCLPTTEYTAAQDYTRDSSYMTAGWGLTEYDIPSTLKRKVMVNSVPIDICVTALESTKINVPKSSWPNIICAGGRKSRDTCQGDSGGPLFKQVSENGNVNWYLYGVTSFGTRMCGQEGIPGIYTRVTTYMDWIREQVART